MPRRKGCRRMRPRSSPTCGSWRTASPIRRASSGRSCASIISAGGGASRSSAVGRTGAGGARLRDQKILVMGRTIREVLDLHGDSAFVISRIQKDGISPARIPGWLRETSSRWSATTALQRAEGVFGSANPTRISLDRWSSITAVSSYPDGKSWETDSGFISPRALRRHHPPAAR